MVDLNLNNSRKRIKILGGGKYQTPVLGHQILASSGTIDSGAFVFASIAQNGGVELGNKSDKDSLSPTTTTIADPNSGAQWGFLVHYNEDGDLVWARTLDADDNSNTRWSCFVVDSANDAVYAAAIENGDMHIRDEAGTLLHTFVKPAGTYQFFAGYCKFQLSTGDLLWTQVSGWSADPGSTSNEIRPGDMAISNDRLYFSGRVRMANGVSAVPTFNGASYPSRSTTFGQLEGCYIVELNTSTGAGIKCVAVDNDTAVSTYNTWCSVGGDIRGHHLTADPVNGRLHLAANHGGNRQQNTGGGSQVNMAAVRVGRGDAGVFSTRIFADWAGSAEEKPYLATFDEDLAPIACSTLALTHDPSVGVNLKSYPAKPAVLSDGSIVWGVQLTNTTSGSVTGLTIDRSGTGGSYGGTSMPNDRRGDTILISTPMDHATPNWTTLFAANTGSVLTDNVRETNVYTNKDKTELIVCHKADGGPFNHVSDINGTSTTQDVDQNWEFGIDISDGSEIWRAKNTPIGTGAYARGVGAHQYNGGPAADKIHMPRMFRCSTTVDFGPNDPDATLAYNIRDTWASTVAARSTICMVVRNADGTVDADECWPMLRSTAAVWTSVYMQDFQGF